MGFPQVRRWRLTKPRAGVLFSGRDEELERYAFYPLRNLLDVMGSVRGLDILEIGPGDFMTSGLALLAAGAQTYTVIDRFVGDYQKPEAKVWYRGIQDAWPRLFPDMAWPEYLRAEDCPEAYSDRVKILTGTIEEATAPKQYDVVCSYQVGEHVDDIDAFARANAAFPETERRRSSSSGLWTSRLLGLLRRSADISEVSRLVVAIDGIEPWNTQSKALPRGSIGAGKRGSES